MTWYYTKARQNKYGNIQREYKNRIFDSKKEANYAVELDIRKMAGEIKEWIPQYQLSLDVNGKHITNYYVDFKVVMDDGSEELHEVKGFQTEVFRLKWKLCEAIYGDQYKMILIK